LKKKDLSSLKKTKDQVKCASFENFTPLHEVFFDSKNVKQTENPNKIETIKFLLENKCDSNSKTLYGETPFHCACANKNISFETVKFLLEKKADPNLKNYDNETPVDWAEKNNSNLKKQISENFRMELEEFFEQFTKIEEN